MDKMSENASKTRRLEQPTQKNNEATDAALSKSEYNDNRQDAGQPNASNLNSIENNASSKH